MLWVRYFDIWNIFLPLLFLWLHTNVHYQKVLEWKKCKEKPRPILEKGSNVQFSPSVQKYRVQSL